MQLEAPKLIIVANEHVGKLVFAAISGLNTFSQTNDIIVVNHTNASSRMYPKTDVYDYKITTAYFENIYSNVNYDLLAEEVFLIPQKGHGYPRKNWWLQYHCVGPITFNLLCNKMTSINRLSFCKNDKLTNKRKSFISLLAKRYSKSL